MGCIILVTQESIIFFSQYFGLQCLDHCGVSKRVNFPMQLSFPISKVVNMAQGKKLNLILQMHYLGISS